MNHGEILDKISEGMRPEVYIELGVYRAKNFNMISTHAKEAWAVDIEDVKNLVRSDRHFFCGTTQEFSDHWNTNIQKPIDLIFIDADHCKESVINDVANFLPWLKGDTGLMVLHDTWPKNKAETAPGYSGDSYLVPGYIKNVLGPRIEILTYPYLCGLTFIRIPGDDWRNG